LANAELAIMDLLWRNGRMTARDLREQLYPDATKAQHGTVQRLLQRLEEKGFLERDKSIAIHFFSPRVSREAYGARQLEELVDKLTSGSIAPLLTHLVEEKKISRDEIRRIRDILSKSPRESSSKRQEGVP
jgi:predicted transcriptional regulator